MIEVDVVSAVAIQAAYTYSMHISTKTAFSSNLGSIHITQSDSSAPRACACRLGF